MKIVKIKAGGFFMIIMVLLQTPELSAGPSGNRINNGPDARKNAFPWMVRLVSMIGLLQGLPQGFQLCGGTLLNSNVVLSAAHCTFRGKMGPPIHAQMMKVHLGDHDTKRHEYGEQNAGVIDYRVHPHYNHYNQDADNDFSLLFLDRNIVFSKTISSACLPNPSKNYENILVTAAGWGIDETGNTPNILQQVDLKTMSNRHCNYKWGGGLRLTKNMICADGHYKGTCSGDSGGPLMVKGREKIVIGVTSWGITDICYGNQPNVFARVSSQLEWIKANAGNICVDQFK